MSLMAWPAHADTFFDAGTTAYGRGDNGKAIELWFQSNDPRAQHMLGIMARTGKLKAATPFIVLPDGSTRQPTTATCQPSSNSLPF